MPAYDLVFSTLARGNISSSYHGAIVHHKGHWPVSQLPGIEIVHSGDRGEFLVSSASSLPTYGSKGQALLGTGYKTTRAMPDPAMRGTTTTCGPTRFLMSPRSKRLSNDNDKKGPQGYADDFTEY